MPVITNLIASNIKLWTIIYANAGEKFLFYKKKLFFPFWRELGVVCKTEVILFKEISPFFGDILRAYAYFYLVIGKFSAPGFEWL